MIANAGLVMSIRLQSVRVSGFREYPFDTVWEKRVGSFSIPGRPRPVVRRQCLTGWRQHRVLPIPPYLRLNPHATPFSRTDHRHNAWMRRLLRSEGQADLD